MKAPDRCAFLIIAIAACSLTLRAETGYAAWLRYEPIADPNVREIYRHLPASTVVLDSSLVEQAAQRELIHGVAGMLGRTPRIDAQLPDEDCIVLGTLSSVKQTLPGISLPDRLIDDSYLLKETAI